MYSSYIGFHGSSRVERSTSVYAPSSFLDHQNKALPNTNRQPFTIAPAHTHHLVNVTAALNPSQLMEPHLHFTLIKCDVTISPLLVLHFK